jgi:hypothetical protein
MHAHINAWWRVDTRVRCHQRGFTGLLGPRGMNGLKITKQHQTTSSDQLAHQAPAQLPPPPF